VTDDRRPSLTLLLPADSGRRNRRTVDAVLVLATAVVAALAAVVARSAPEVDEEIGHAVATVLGWAPGVWRAVLLGALGIALAIVADALIRRRWLLARDVLIALALVLVLSGILGQIVDSEWVQLDVHVLSHWGFPELRLASVAAVIAVSRPELVRPIRLFALWLLALAAVGALALEIATPSEALAGLALGLGAGAVVRVAFGSPLGVPPLERVQAALAALDVQVADLRIAERQRIGYAEYLGQDGDGPLKVRVLGRDAQDTQRVARRWRLLAYRDPPRSSPIGRLEQVEHEALTTMMAAQAGVRVPRVVAVGVGRQDDAVLVTRQEDVAPLELASPDQVGDELLEELMQQVARLHEAGIAHGRLNASNVIVVDGEPVLVDFSAATLGAPQATLDIDVAELLVACCVLVGPERTLATAVEAGWADAVSRVLPYLQRAALTPHLRDLARAHEVDLKELRAAAAEATGVPEPELAQLRRIRPRDVLTMAALVFAAYLIISQLAQIGFGTIARELGDAQPVWVLVALLLAQSTFVGNGVSVRGAVPAPLPLLPCVVLQAAMKFVNLTVPSSAGRIAMNLRFLQQLGVSRPQALAAGAVDDLSNTIVQAGLFLLVLPFVGASVEVEFHGKAPDARLLAALGVALLVSALVVAFVPKVHDRVVPGVKSALSGLWSVARDRRKRVELFGGTGAAELLYAISLGATCLAYGVHLNVAQLVFVNTSAAVLAGLIPVPGGIGAAEAAISAGLIAMGVDQSIAFAVALTQRLSTFYLPPIWGYFGLRWLERKGYV
jgi:uncharacterized membrane protein YbhN (UPF0104 family)/tRNA A-37 threonylcarbamoyl transferase component Bud32